MHEGLDAQALEKLKSDIQDRRTKGLWNGAAVKEIAWSALTKQQFDEITSDFGLLRPIATSLWNDPDIFRQVAETDVDTSTLGAGLKSETSKLGWFLYFLKEANLRRDKTPAQREQLLKIMRKYLRKPLNGQGSEFKAPLDSFDPTELRTDLTALLKIGFTPLCGVGQGNDTNDCSDVALLQFQRQGQVYTDIDYRWRADSRSFKTVSDDAGFKTKADSEGYARANGMRDAYHPFSLAENRQYLWFRRGQTDNCLYTVVSIGKSADWKGYLPFPKLDSNLPKALFETGGIAPISTKYSTKYAMCKVGPLNKSIKLPVTETWLYMFLLTGLVIETNRIQNKLLGGDAFPEEGVREIPLGDIFGAVRFYRFHHGPSDDDGFTAVPEAGGLLHFRNPFFQEAKYSRKGFELLKTAFSDAAYTGPVSVKWTAHGHSPIEPGFTFKGEKIERIIGLSMQT